MIHHSIKGAAPSPDRDSGGMNARRGLLLVLSGPSGTGKTTLARRLLDRHGGPGGSLIRSVSVTTRPARSGEIEGTDYFFITDACFTTLLSTGELLEHANLYGFHYGSPRSFVETCLERGADVLLVLDAAGRRQIARSHGTTWSASSCCHPRWANWKTACAAARRKTRRRFPGGWRRPMPRSLAATSTTTSSSTATLT